MSLSLAQLRQFVALAEAGSVGRAARTLRVSQPGVTKNLRALEAVVGVALMRRTARGTELTEHGRMFLLRARSACHEIERGQEELACGKASQWPGRARCVTGGGGRAAASAVQAFSSRVCRRHTRHRGHAGGDVAARAGRVARLRAGPVVARTPRRRSRRFSTLSERDGDRRAARSSPCHLKRSLAELVDSEWITAGLGTSQLVVDDMFAAAGLVHRAGRCGVSRFPD